MKPNGPFAVLAASLAAALFTACSLNPKEDPTRYYVLSAISEDPGLYASAGLTGSTLEEAAASAGPAVDYSVGVGPVTLPTYLKRNRMVTRKADNELMFLEAERWGEPMQEALQHALASNVGLMLGTVDVALHPWYATERPDLTVMVDVARFERDSDGTASLAARWEIRDAEGVTLASDSFRLSRPPGDASIAASVKAQSELVAQLSREIADAIRRVAS